MNIPTLSKIISQSNAGAAQIIKLGTVYIAFHGILQLSANKKTIMDIIALLTIH